jgi:hypothetical protein
MKKLCTKNKNFQLDGSILKLTHKITAFNDLGVVAKKLAIYKRKDILTAKYDESTSNFFNFCKILKTKLN